MRRHTPKRSSAEEPSELVQARRLGIGEGERDEDPKTRWHLGEHAPAQLERAQLRLGERVV